MAHMMVRAAFSEADLIGLVMEESRNDGWTYAGFIPGPQTSVGGGVAIGGLGAAHATVDQSFYLIYWKEGDCDAPEASPIRDAETSL